MTNPYAPNETHAEIFAEAAWLQGALLSNIAYGVELTLFLICFSILVQRADWRFSSVKESVLLVFVTVIFILGSLLMGSNAKFTQLAFIENRNFPGGPSAYEQAMFWIPVDELGNVALVIGNWLMDLLLVWRCMVIYSASRPAFLLVVMSVPCALLIASFILGILFLIQTSASSPFGAVDYTLAYGCMTLGLNVVVTILIVGRLLLHRRRVRRTLGPQHISHYTNAAAILVESASIFTVYVLIFLVTFAIGSPLAQAFVQALSQVQSVASLLITFRVVTGRGWTQSTGTQGSMHPGPSPIRLKVLSGMRFRSEATDSATTASKPDTMIVLDDGNTVQ